MNRDPRYWIRDETGYGACGEIGECKRPSVCEDDFLADSGSTWERAPTSKTDPESQGDLYCRLPPVQMYIPF